MMAAYPSYPQLVETRPQRNEGITVDIMESGVVRGAAAYDKAVIRVTARHFITAADLTALRALVGTTVQFQYDGDEQPGTIYDMIVQNIEDRWHPSGKYFVDVTMVGNPQ